jgi:nucleoside phosphorylase
MSLRPHPPVKDFTVWWLYALPIEFAAAQAVLDEIYDAKDIPQFILGRSGRHGIVVGCLPAGQIGLSSATAVATELHCIFPSLKHGLMVGIAGGVPSVDTDIRLGDVIISQPQRCNGGVVQYDFGKVLADGKFFRAGSLNSPPRDLLVAVSRMKSNKADSQRRVNASLANLAEQRQAFNRPSMDTDRLFESSYNHVQGKLCDHCLEERSIKRTNRIGEAIAIHYGTVASGNRLIKDGRTRDYLSAELGGVLCFEMEAAGLMNSFPCLIVRGVCDYADSQKIRPGNHLQRQLQLHAPKKSSHSQLPPRCRSITTNLYYSIKSIPLMEPSKLPIRKHAAGF